MLRSRSANSISRAKSTKFRRNTHTNCKNVRKYFRTRPRAVAARIEIKNCHDVVHHVDNALSKFRDFRRPGRRFSDPSATFLSKFRTIGTGNLITGSGP